jgi:1-deoxy-D-xylulose-5-phosphate reductoisomerase
VAVKRIAVLGATGSVGRQALDVVARFPDRFEVVGLAAARGSARLAEQVRHFRPRRVAVADAAAAQ